MRRSWPYLLLLPALLIVALVVLLPLVFSLYSSFTAYRLTRPDSITRFIGFANYVRLFQDMDFWWAFGRTILFLTIVLNAELSLGLGLALLLEQVTRGQRLLRTILMFPMMFSPILVGFQFKFMFNDNIGIVNYILQHGFGMQESVPWLVDGRLALFALAVAEIWNSTSVFAILLLAGLMSMPSDPIEAAKVDGCSAWQAFRHVTLPYLMPFVWIAMTIRSLEVGRAFDIVKIMTNGGPGGRTELIWTLMARTGYVDGRMGLANAMGYISIILSMAFTVHFFAKLSAARRHVY
ncbi:carbohydrate ABC transporter permease [Verminephrobacter eiseniae]|uniref:Binding-protein-dependent transport systems inner membrane component n=1 Tax=Verminephrobacter eiseniae (strain EF01-2) TaxID=391735 RepID=A1WK70_VEREI|nr:sugar ABC transporter permease [Verminephrobacter eiseniae]KAB7619326.1 sugar ABC transporter permease [Verminephrobacter sp. Larva24]ABM58027.1 binding-protein-dependent transport systems inner membrane component [Verminephrobacter eiseniae EF01-2]MCW5230076.1 sugar ABC transporter permease [Verminephrobacter eiseniae]MCW5263303.1 sugar ABC transporter permease [Verminephrobacter eiseniae]MCW5283631.1 sugar ABC transporter permease [Verminephrobacter eiseniae]